MISLHGAYYSNNYGDVLILAIQSRWIKEIVGKEECVVLPFASKIFRKTINSSRESGLKGIKLSQKLIYGAGGYFGEPLERKWRWGFSFFKKHFIAAEYAIFRNIDYAIIGTGVGPLTNIFTKFEVKRICSKAKVIVVRDKESKRYLIEYGIEENKIVVTSDVALSLTRKDLPHNAVKTIDNLLKDCKKLKYGIHIGVDKDNVLYGEKVQSLLDEIILFLNDNPYITPVLIIDHNNIKQKKAVAYIKSKIKSDYIIYQHEDVWETTSLLAELDVVLTNKLHVGIVSYAFGTMSISFPYHPKTTRFYEQIGQEDLCTPVMKIVPNQVYDILDKTLDQAWIRAYNNKRDLVYPKLKQKALLNKAYIEQFIERY